jgi:hypothetical protein
VSTFIQGFEYAHGGLSLQEALTPVLTVTACQPPVEAVQVGSAEWKGLRLRVQLQGGYAGTVLDIRTKPADAGSTLLGPGHGPKAPDADGRVSLVVEDDSLAGTSALLVVLREGQVVAKLPLLIGPE